jgi:Rieske 2Fe-2S family protein
VVESGTDPSRSGEPLHRVDEQDFAAWERPQSAGSSRAHARGGVLVLSEHHMGAFHDRMTQRLADRARPPRRRGSVARQGVCRRERLGP